MHNKYSPKGLTIVALCGSGAEKFVKDNKINYPVGMGGPNSQNYGISAIPHTYLINARGKIAWEGHTATPQQVEELLAKVRVLPNKDWPKGVEKIAKAAAAGNLGEASKLLGKLKPDGDEEEAAAKEIQEYVDWKIGDIFAEAEEAEKDGDYFFANQVLAAAKKSLAGHEAAERASEKLKAYQKDKAIAAAIRAGALYEQAQALELQKKPKDALQFYAQAAKVGAGTKVGERARAKVEELSAK